MGYYERPRYEVIKQEKPFELRAYEDFHIVKYKDSEDPNLYHAFQTLFQYISRENEKSEKINMTVPVIEKKSELGMSMAFVVPQALKDSIPLPNDERLKIEHVSGGLYAVVCYRGVTNTRLEDEQKKGLVKWIEENDLEIKGEFLIALYNPPIVPGILRHNEIWVEVK